MADRSKCREEKGFSQAELAKQIDAYHSIIGKYERDEVKPAIDVVKKPADVLDTTVGYLLGETEERELLIGTSSCPAELINYFSFTFTLPLLSLCFFCSPFFFSLRPTSFSFFLSFTH